MTHTSLFRVGRFKKAVVGVVIVSALFLIAGSSLVPNPADGEVGVRNPSFDRAQTMTADQEQSVTVASATPALPVETPTPQASADGAIVTETGVDRPDPRPNPVCTFQGRPLRKARDLIMLVTAYSPDERSCGIWARHGITASGKPVTTNGGKLVAADTTVLPFDTLISVPGYHAQQPVPVLDRGGKVKGNHIDLLFPTHEQAVKWGVKRLRVTVWEFAD